MKSGGRNRIDLELVLRVRGTIRGAVVRPDGAAAAGRVVQLMGHATGHSRCAREKPLDAPVSANLQWSGERRDTCHKARSALADGTGRIVALDGKPIAQPSPAPTRSNDVRLSAREEERCPNGDRLGDAQVNDARAHSSSNPDGCPARGYRPEPSARFDRPRRRRPACSSSRVPAGFDRQGFSRAAADPERGGEGRGSDRPASVHPRGHAVLAQSPPCRELRRRRRRSTSGADAAHSSARYPRRPGNSVAACPAALHVRRVERG